MPVVVRVGATVHFEIWGESGPWVTLINGHLRPLTDFRMLGQRLVKAGFRVLALDNRGSGQTHVEQPFSLMDMVEDILSIWDHIGCEASHVLGISMGGFIAQTLALASVDRVRSLVLMSTAPDATVLRRDESSWDKDPEKVFAKLSRYFAPDFVRRNPLLVQSMAKQMARAAERGELQTQAALQRRAVADFNATSFLPKIMVPTLVVHGALDAVIALDSGRQLAAAVPGARLEVLPDTGHLILAERPKELLDLLVGLWTTF